MNTKFMKAWAVLAFTMAFTVAAYANQSEVIVVRTFKVDNNLIGVTSDYRIVGIVCGYFSADLVFPNKDGKLSLTGYNASGRTPALDRTAYKTLSSEAKDAVCTMKPGEFSLDVGTREVELIGKPRDFTVQGNDSTRNF